MAVLAAGAAAAFAIPNSVLPAEPTWAMMILGIGIVGSSMRRRKVDIAFA
ncbi:MAG: PEPxxWA-CTERM sorting domain-containing protein [Sphingobium sp.]|nr:PEPxxWA-CTERM sorting domain-containing protein [Sphingobium sp.]